MRIRIQARNATVKALLTPPASVAVLCERWGLRPSCSKAHFGFTRLDTRRRTGYGRIAKGSDG